MKHGYQRVSTRDQNLDLQTDALFAAGCDRIYSEQVSGAAKVRPELERMISQLRPGDTVVVWKLDRLGRSLPDLIRVVNEIHSAGAEFQSLQDKVDTSSPHGKLVFHLFASIAEFERDLIRERTRAGLAAARARGRKGGRPAGLSKANKVKAAAAASMYREGTPVADILAALDIARGTLYRWLRLHGLSHDRSSSSAGM